MSEFVPKPKSWAQEEGERQSKRRAAEEANRKRLAAEYDRKFEEMRKSGKSPSLGDILARDALLGRSAGPLSGIQENRKKEAIESILRGFNDPASPPAVLTYRTADVTTKSGRVVECEIEVRSSPSRGISLTWRDKKK